MKLKDIIATANEALKALAGKRFQGPDGMTQFHTEKSNILSPIAREAKLKLNTWSLNDRHDNYIEYFDIVLEFKDDNVQSHNRRGRVISVTIRQKYECSPEATLDQYIRLIKFREVENSVTYAQVNVTKITEQLREAEIHLVATIEKRDALVNKPDHAEFWAAVTQPVQLKAID